MRVPFMPLRSRSKKDGSFNLKWLELGHGVSDEIYAGIRKLDTQLEAANN